MKSKVYTAIGSDPALQDGCCNNEMCSTINFYIIGYLDSGGSDVMFLGEIRKQ